MAESKNTKHSIFEYTEYRLFLQDYYLRTKELRPEFSFRVFSRLAGFSSPNFLKLVIKGERNLSLESIPKFVAALKLRKDEARFFESLVLLSQAKAPEAKRQLTEKVLGFRSYKKFHPLKGDEYRYYTQWYWVPVRELVGLPDFDESPEWVAKTLLPAITVEQAKEALEGLEKLGLISRDSAGQLRQTDSVVTTEDEFSSAAFREFHREMLKRASESIALIPRMERELSAATVGLSEESAKRVKLMIQKLRKKILEIADQDAHPERVYQVGLQLFPLSKKKEGGEL